MACNGIENPHFLQGNNTLKPDNPLFYKHKKTPGTTGTGRSINSLLNVLTFRVLRTFARFVQSDFLALDFAGIAGQEARLAKR